MRPPLRHLLPCALLLGLTPPASAAGPAVTANPSLESWRADRFGLFIHWGPVSLKGTEIGWSRAGERRGYGGPGTIIPTEVYDNLYREFNPTLFNAREWVAIAQAAGMKYLVFTSRHHDGFSMFDTQASDYKITSPLSPFRRDVVRELADACHAANIKFGLYYSQPDWHHPDAFTPDRHDRYLAYLKAQVRELCTNYGRLDILWFDGLRKKAEDYDGVAVNRTARELQPHLLINNRNGIPEDFDTPEQRVGKYQDMVELPSLPRQVKSATLLGGGRATVHRHDAKTHLSVDPANRAAIDTIVKLELAGSAMDIPSIPLTPPVKASASHADPGNTQDFSPPQAFDGDTHTRWAAPAGTQQAWIARDFEKNVRVSRVRLVEAVGQRVQRFELQYRTGSAWKTIFAGTKIGRQFERTFPPVTAREFRLNILDAADGPTIAEIELLEK